MSHRLRIAVLGDYVTMNHSIWPAANQDSIIQDSQDSVTLHSHHQGQFCYVFKNPMVLKYFAC